MGITQGEKRNHVTRGGRTHWQDHHRPVDLCSRLEMEKSKRRKFSPPIGCRRPTTSHQHVHTLSTLFFQLPGSIFTPSSTCSAADCLLLNGFFQYFLFFFPTFAGCFGRCCFEAFPFIVGASAGFGCSAGNAAFHLRWASKSASLETIEKLLYTHTQAWLTHWWTGRQKQQVSTGLSCHHHPQPSSTLHTHYVCVPVIMDN